MVLPSYDHFKWFCLLAICDCHFKHPLYIECGNNSCNRLYRILILNDSLLLIVGSASHWRPVSIQAFSDLIIDGQMGLMFRSFFNAVVAQRCGLPAQHIVGHWCSNFMWHHPIICWGVKHNTGQKSTTLVVGISPLKTIGFYTTSAGVVLFSPANTSSAIIILESPWMLYQQSLLCLRLSEFITITETLLNKARVIINSAKKSFPSSWMHPMNSLYYRPGNVCHWLTTALFLDWYHI